MPQSTFEKLSLICLVSSTVPSALALATALNTARSVNLFERQSQTCGGDPKLAQCGNGLPTDFCCTKDWSCLRLNNTAATTVLCCPPGGAGCSSIAPITCDIQQQNATAFPSNSLHISDMSKELPKCGTECCPLGFKCQNNLCVMLPETKEPGASPSSPNPTDPSTSGSSSKPTALPISTTPEESCSKFPGGAVAAGFFPGALVGMLLTLLALWLLKRRRTTRSASKATSPDFGSVSRQISDPIYDPAYASRVDFIRRGTNSSKAPTHADTATLLNHDRPDMRHRDTLLSPKVRSLFSRSPKVPQGRYSARSSSYTSRARGEKLQRGSLGRNGSSETIDVLMPAPAFLQVPDGGRPGTARPTTRDTTFTNLMEDAGYSRQSRDGVRQASNGSVQGRAL